MGKRIIRIFSSEVDKQLPRYVGQMGHLVLKNRCTYFGNFFRYENGIIFLKDLTAKIHKFPLTEVEEVVFDVESPF